MGSEPIDKPLKLLMFYCIGTSGKLMIMEKENLLDISAQRTALKERFANEPTRIVEDVETLSLDPDIYLAAINAELGRAGIVNKNGRIYRVDEFLQQNERLQARLDAGEFVDGELGHPESGATFEVPARLVSVSTMVDGNTATAEGTFAILNTTAGRDLLTLYRAGLDVGVSSRGSGLVEKVVLDESSEFIEANPGYIGRSVAIVSEFELDTYDLVRVPSAGTFVKRERQDEAEVSVEAAEELEMSDQNTEIVEEAPATADNVQAESDPLAKLDESQREVLLKIVEAVSFENPESADDTRLAAEVAALREQLDVNRERSNIHEAEVASLNEKITALEEEKNSRELADALAVAIEEAVDGKRFSGLVRKELNFLVESEMVSSPEAIAPHADRFFSMMEEASAPIAEPVIQEVVDAADDVTESVDQEDFVEPSNVNELNEQLIALIRKQNRA
mgnify:CR=1 FL=1|tara:strand:+ start:956 stop:2305 length:1350 start_codon:yes stop_codon:yes gene_type:complete